MSQPRVVGDTRLAQAAQRAIDKLMAALPPSMREQAASIRQRLHVDTTGWRGVTEDLAMLPIVQDAVARDRKLTLRYWRAGRERVERTVDPLGLVAKGSTWYLVAGTPAGLRTYRVSRIETAELLDVATERPSDFDLADYWRTSTAAFQDGWPRFDATLRVESESARWMQRWETSQVPAGEAPDPEGWVTLRVRFEHEDQALFVVLGLGPRVDVLEPQGLRDRAAAELYATLKRREGR
jgi:predicted DNA-binding transcriptional regulator YafY